MSTRGITGKRRRPKIHPRSAGPGFLSFRFLANNSPRSSFQRHGLPPSFDELSRGTLYPGLLPRPANQRDAPTNPNARPANFIMYILSTTGHLCPKKMVESAGHSSGWRMWARVIATNNCDLSELYGDGYICFITVFKFSYGNCSKYQVIQRWIIEHVDSINFINLYFLI